MAADLGQRVDVVGRELPHHLRLPFHIPRPLHTETHRHAQTRATLHSQASESRLERHGSKDAPSPRRLQGRRRHRPSPRPRRAGHPPVPPRPPAGKHAPANSSRVRSGFGMGGKQSRSYRGGKAFVWPLERGRRQAQHTILRLPQPLRTGEEGGRWAARPRPASAQASRHPPPASPRHHLPPPPARRPQSHRPSALPLALQSLG